MNYQNFKTFVTRARWVVLLGLCVALQVAVVSGQY